MFAEERQQILKMVADGKISADEAMKLMKVLDESSIEMEIIEAAPASSSGPDAGSNSRKPNAPEFEEVAQPRASNSGKFHCGSVCLLLCYLLIGYIHWLIHSIMDSGFTSRGFHFYWEC